jgi:two-component system chemotaxis sensor kinase CheA
MMQFDRKLVFTAEGRDMVMIDEQPMPLLSMADILELPASELAEDDNITLLVLAVGERAVALEVDELFSELELVLKPLGTEIANAPFVSGAALLGTGEVIIVLDANALIRGANSGQRVRVMVRRTPEATLSSVPERLRVLIVDDSITTRTLEKHILETAGFDVQVAIDGVEAWTILTETDFDVLITDVEMPNMDGLELTRRVKESTDMNRLPVILLTSLAKPEQREAGLKVGADAYLVKSKFDQAELLSVIRALV